MERLIMRVVQEIIFRLRHRQSERSIARDLDLSRDAVHRYHQLAQASGFLNPDQALPDEGALLAVLGEPIPPPRAVSLVEPHRRLVLDWVDRGVEARAIHQRLVDGHGFTGSYSAVLRFVSKLRPTDRESFVRIETPPGEQAQIDFGTLGPLYDRDAGRSRTVYAFVMTLSYSRHQYLEFVFDQTIPTWIRCHRRAFERFGGVPRTLVIDNLKSAVLVAALEDSVLSLPYGRLGQYYGCLIHPCRPRTPEHKGKVESGIRYVERNFYRGRGETFSDLTDINRQGARWVAEVAGTRDHGTTHQPPLERFERIERSTLLPLPPQPFQLLEVRQAKVQRDCHVTVGGSYYSVPFTHVGRPVEVHLSEGIVSIYDGSTLLVSHARCNERGQRVTRLDDYPPDKATVLRMTPEFCRDQAHRIGPGCTELVDTLLSDRPVDQRGAVRKLIRLEDTHGAESLEAACVRALHYGDPHYRRVKQILRAQMETAPLTENGPLFQSGGPAASSASLEAPSSSESELTSQTSPPSGLLGSASGPVSVPGRSYTYARSAQEFFPAEFFRTEEGRSSGAALPSGPVAPDAPVTSSKSERGTEARPC